MDNDQDARPGDIMAPLRQSQHKPTVSAMTATPDGTVSGGTADGGTPAGDASASGNGIEPATDASANGTQKDTSGTSGADATIADGVPALPADTIGQQRTSRSKEPGPDQQTPPGQADGQPLVGDIPAYSFDPQPPAPVWPASEDQTIAESAESVANPSRDDHAPSSANPPLPAESPAVSPAAFAWEMADPPSSPARTFLRSGATAKSPAPPQAVPSAGPSAGPSSGQSSGPSARLGQAAVAAQGPVTAPGGSPKAQKAPKAQSKRAARQAHLTVARVEPWSVMKFSFVVSLVAFVILFVAVSLLYAILNGIGVFDSIQHVVSSLTSSQTSTGVNAKAWFSASRILGYTALLGSANIVLITAMSTIGAVVYNLTSRLVGGVEVTLRETE